MASTVIGSTIVIEGEISGEDSLLIHGTVRGRIDLRERVEVATDGVVEASIVAPVVTVYGTVAGDITADERAELRAECQVVGDVRAPRILIADGAAFKGRVDMGG